MKKQSGLLLLSLLLILSSCIREGIGEGCYQDLFINLDWLDTQPVTTEGKPVTVDVVPVKKGGDGETQQSDIRGTETNVIAGEYVVMGYEKADNIEVNVDKQTVSVNSSTDGEAKEPGNFSAGSTVVTIERGKEAPEIKVPLHKQVRKLVIQLQVKGLYEPGIEKIEAVFDGIALDRHINNGFPPHDGTRRPNAIKRGKIGYDFDFIEQNQYGGWYEGSRTLLGIDGGGRQTISLTIRFSDGFERTVSADITDAMDGFHTEELGQDQDNPWYVLLVLNVGELEILIDDWEDGGTSWIIAES